LSLDRLRVVFDTVQTRLQSDRLSLTFGFDDWDLTTNVDLYVDKVTNTVFLCPLPLSPDWFLNSTGNYTRLKKTDFTFGTPSSWVESDRLDNGHSNYLQSQGVSEVVKTNATLDVDRGMYVSYFSPGTGTEKQTDIEFGWGNSGTFSDGISVRVRSDGHTEVWKNGVFKWSGDISGQQAGQQTDLQTVNLCCIPCRGRELLILSNQGTGFSAIFDDIDEANPPVGAVDHVPILPASKFWFRVYGDATIEVAPVHYHTLGGIYSKPMQWAETVSADETITPTLYPDISDDEPYELAVILTEATTSAIFDGGDKCRLNIAMLSNGNYTPMLYACEEELERTTQKTVGGGDDNKGIDVTDYVVDCTVDVGDDPSGATVELVFKNPEEVEALGVYNFLNMSNRAVQIFIGDRLIMSGRTDAPERVLGVNDTADRISIKVRDHWKALETYLYSDPKALDGFVYTDAIKWLIKSAGLDDTDIWYVPDNPAQDDYIDLVLPDVGTQSQGFNIQIAVADSPADWLKRLVEGFAGDYTYGFQPYNYHDDRGSESRFRMFKPDDNDGATVKLYIATEDAYDALGVDIAESPIEDLNRARRRTVLRYQDTLFEPEANYVCVIGQDASFQRPLRSIRKSGDAQDLIDHPGTSSSCDPGVPPGGRKSNWLGEIRKYMHVDSTLTTQSAVDDCADTIFNKVSVPHLTAEFEADLIINDANHLMWRGDVVEIDSIGRFRITSFHGRMNREGVTADHDKSFRRFTYTALYIGESFTE